MFENITGNEPVKEILRRLVRSERVPQSLLLAGREGIGKRLFAFEVARSIVCTADAAERPCSRCPACLRVGQLSLPKREDRDAHRKVIFTGHPDVGTVIPFKQSILIDAVRDLEKEANFRPFEAAKRVFVIDDAERLSAVFDNAANALLKTLEEPPETTHIILVSSRPLQLLSTIRSRCQQIRFGPVSKEEIAERLRKEKELGSEDAAVVAGSARGSLGRALSTDLQAFKEQRSSLLQMLEACSRRRGFALLLRRSEELAEVKTREEYEDALGILQTLIHDAWLLKRRGHGAIVNVDIADRIAELAENTDAERLSCWLEEIEGLLKDLGFNLNRKIASDGLVMRMAG